MTKLFDDERHSDDESASPSIRKLLIFSGQTFMLYYIVLLFDFIAIIFNTSTVLSVARPKAVHNICIVTEINTKI